VSAAPAGSNPYTSAASGSMAQTGGSSTGTTFNPFGQPIGAVASQLGRQQQLGSNPYGMSGAMGPTAQVGNGFTNPYANAPPPAPAAVPTSANAHFPKTDFLTYRSDAKIFPKMKAKIETFAGEIDADPDTMSDGPALREQDATYLAHIFEILTDQGHYHSTCFTDHDIGCVLRLLKTWSPAKVFPVMDAVRCMLLHPDGAKRCANAAFVDLMIAAAGPAAPAANQGIALKFLCNLLYTPEGRALVGGSVEMLDKVLGYIAEFVSAEGKKLRVDVGSALVNVSAMVYQGGTVFGETHAIQCLAMQVELMAPTQDPEVVYRALVSSGTLAKGDAGGYKAFCSQDENWVKCVVHHDESGALPKVKECAQAIGMMH